METKVNKATCASISVTGYIGSITVKEKEEGKVSVFLRIATHRKIYVDDQPVDKTDWHNAVAYGNIAKILKEHAKKGDLIIINGDLEEWNFNEEGNESKKFFIKINKMQFKTDCYATIVGIVSSIYRKDKDSPTYVTLCNIRTIKNKDGEFEDSIDYINVVFYYKIAELIEEHVEKGFKILVSGSLEVSEQNSETSIYNDERSYIRAYSAKIL